MVKKSRRKVLLIGWDAADWKVITPLLDAGKMPALERMIDSGVMGNIATLQPVLSPMLWTSIATRMRAYKHGILGFTEPDPDTGAIRPVASASRKVKAIWNILNQEGYRSNVIGWWPSHPAEAIDGVMVSNLFHRAHQPIDRPWTMPPGAVHPPELAEKLKNLRIHPGELTSAHILPFVPQAAKIDQEKDRRLESLARTIADCSTVHAIATAVMQLEPWDFMAVYYDAIDHLGHTFMRYHPPRQEHIAPKDYELFKNVIEAGYRFHDSMLGVLLQLAGQDTTVILLSDHGFYHDHLRPANILLEPAGPAIEHRQFGILVMKGPGVQKDERIYGAGLLDITPTVLNLFDLAAGDDMDGKPLAQAFEKSLKIKRIPTWEAVPGDSGMHPENKRFDPAEAQAAIRQLVDLGYLEEPDERDEQALQATVRENSFNRAQSLMGANRFEEAITILRQLTGEYPRQLRFLHRLILCFHALEKKAEFEQTIESYLHIHEEILSADRNRLTQLKNKAAIERLTESIARGAHTWDYFLGILESSRGDLQKALLHLRKAEQESPRLPHLHLQIGRIYVKMNSWTDAGRAFNRALEIDPDDARAHFGLSIAHLSQRRDMLAASEALTAVGLLYHFPQAHYQLGVALNRLGLVERAVEALQVTLSMAPGMIKAHRLLARIYETKLDDPGKSLEHRNRANDLARRRKNQLARNRRAPIAKRK